MYNTIPDKLRKTAVENLFATPNLQKIRQAWQPEIARILGTNYSENEILDLGDNLSNIFRTTGGTGRGQSSLSGGGNAWESLVCWYINLCTVGSRTVAIKKMSLVPKPIQDAITVNYGNFACNTESDITIIIFPDIPEYNTNINDLIVRGRNMQEISAIKKGKFNFELMNYLSERDFNHIEIGIIQCKTNWNDNAQVPMLWDMIYSANGFPGRNISIGRNGFAISHAQRFTYSFVTVPSNARSKFKNTSVSIKRVTNLSGGNYWGKSTSENIARSIKEIFTNNYNAGFREGIRADIRNSLPYMSSNGVLSYFGI